jgi:hypothetical protein
MRIRIMSIHSTHINHPTGMISNCPTSFPHGYAEVNKVFDLNVAFTCSQESSADIENSTVFVDDGARSM